MELISRKERRGKSREIIMRVLSSSIGICTHIFATNVFRKHHRGTPLQNAMTAHQGKQNMQLSIQNQLWSKVEQNRSRFVEAIVDFHLRQISFDIESKIRTMQKFLFIASRPADVSYSFFAPDDTSGNTWQMMLFYFKIEFLGNSSIQY